MRPARLLPASLAAALLCCLAGLHAVGADDVIELGAAVSLTGKYAPHGAHTKDGYELAVRRINEKGGVKVGGKSYRLVVRYYDDESKPARGNELAERLIKQDGVKFMLGPYSSTMTKAMLPVVEKYKVPMVERAERSASSLPRATIISSLCCPARTGILSPPSISPPSTPRSSARPRRR